MQVTDYRVRCDLYQGPLDLLVYLVRRQEVDVMQIRLARIVDEFLEFMAVLQMLDLDVIGDFVVMASTLIEVKSRNVLPRPEEEISETEPLVAESGDDLIRQLMEYKRFKEAATALQDQAAEWQERYPRLTDNRPKIGKDPALDLIRDVELWDLVSALTRILKRADPEEQASIRYDDTPIGVYSQKIRERIAIEGRVSFSDFFEGEKKRGRIVGLFLAILELLRHHGYRAEQPISYGEIWVMPPLPGHERDPRPDESANELTIPDPSVLEQMIADAESHEPQADSAEPDKPESGSPDAD